VEIKYLDEVFLVVSQGAILLLIRGEDDDIPPRLP